MKKLFIIFAVVLFTAGFASKVSAQVTLTDNTAGGEILSPITLTKGSSLEFGKMAVLGTLGTVTIDAAAAPNRSQVGGVTLVTGTTPSAASFTVGGTTGNGYGITVDGTITLTRVSGTETMIVTTSASKTSGVLVASSDIFYVGGSLPVSGTQVAGTYSGTYSVSVNYN